VIAKIVKRTTSKSSFRYLISYILREHIVSNCINNDYFSLNKITRNTNNNIRYEHNCISLSTISDEMNAVATKNNRIKDPVFHLILSWDKDDKPSDEQIFKCAEEAKKSLGFTDEHQYITAIHDDTDNVHVHIVLNKVNSINYKGPTREHNKFNYYKLDKLMRELEVKYNFKHNSGPYVVVNVDGKDIIEKRNGNIHVNNYSKSSFNKYEFYSDNESFYTFVNDNLKKHLLFMLKDNPTWNDINSYLYQYNVKFEVKGQGFVFSTLDSEFQIKASSVNENFSKNRMEKKLGNFTELTEEIKNNIQNKNFYVKLKPLKRDENERAEKRNQRAAARANLKERYQQYKINFKYNRIDQEEIKKKYKLINANSKKKRQQIRLEINSRLQRKAMYSIIAFEAMKAKQQLKYDISLQRKILRNDPNNKKLTYRQWVAIEAQMGDPAAISQLNGWNYAEKRRKRREDICIIQNELSHQQLNNIINKDTIKKTKNRNRR
jgi:hypothetical protein